MPKPLPCVAHPPSPPGRQIQCLYRNVAIFVAIGYDASILVPLIGSYQRYTSECDDIVIITGDAPLPTIRVQRPSNVLFQPASAFPVPDYLKDAPVVDVRFFHIAEWLQAHVDGAYRYVFIGDARDIFFQDDPFMSLTHQGLYSVREIFEFASERVYNVPWVRSCFGEEGVQRMIAANAPVVCAGMIMGGVKAVLDYHRVFLAHRRTRTGCNDQGLHEYLMTVGLRDEGFPHNVTVFDLWTSRYAHQLVKNPSSPPAEMFQDGMGRLLNKNKEPYAVLHQFDRSGAIWDLFQRQYPVVTPDGREYLVHHDR